MVKCECGCGTALKFDPPSNGLVYVVMENPRLETRWCSMSLDANGVVELIRELQEVLDKMVKGV